jgi:DMSO/TMAO reductase YedYZ heme-binding membrane subunit
MSVQQATGQDVKSRAAAAGGSGQAPGDRVSRTLWVAAIIGAALAYAAVRYHVLKGVSWSHFPLYTGNKALALSSVVCIALSYLIGKTPGLPPPGRVRQLEVVKFLGLAGFSMAAIHGAVSTVLLSPAYYEKFFMPDGRMNLTGELSMLFGVLSLWCLTIPAITSLPFMNEHLGPEKWRRMQRMGYAALALNCVHVFVMGFGGWLDFAAWPGGLPPITMLGFAVSAAALLGKMIHVSASGARG